MHVHLARVAFGYSDAEPIVEDLALDLAPGWTGLVGANGAGKSTLRALVAGDVRPDQGVVRLDPSHARVVFCPQRVDDPGDGVAQLAAAADADAARLRGRLALDPAELARWDTLSPGERRRWPLGAAIAA